MIHEPWAGAAPSLVSGTFMGFPARVSPEAPGKQWKSTRCSQQPSSSALKVEIGKFPKAGEALLVVPGVTVRSLRKYLSWMPIDPAVSEVSRIMRHGPFGDRASHRTHQEVDSCLETQAALRVHSGFWSDCSKVNRSFRPPITKTSLTPVCELHLLAWNWDSGMFLHCFC